MHLTGNFSMAFWATVQVPWMNSRFGRRAHSMRRVCSQRMRMKIECVSNTQT
jgi:hypothetical protein